MADPERFHRARRRGVFPRFGTLATFWALSLLIALPDPVPNRVRAERLAPSAKRGPNLLLIIADDHGGGTLGIDGDPRKATPRLDALARQGARFDRAYCNSPVCTPSRQSLITGRLPHAVGVTQLETRLPDDAITLGDWLGDLGYLTAAFGKMHFNGPAHHGFARRLDHADWLAHLKLHPPEGGDQRRPWRPFQDPAAVWLNADCRSDGLPDASMESTYYADRGHWSSSSTTGTTTAGPSRWLSASTTRTRRSGSRASSPGATAPTTSPCRRFRRPTVGRSRSCSGR